jgi:hypothetical protein
MCTCLYEDSTDQYHLPMVQTNRFLAQSWFWSSHVPKVC